MATQETVTVPIHKSLILPILAIIRKYQLHRSVDTSIFPEIENEHTENSILYYEMPQESTAILTRVTYENARESAERVAALSLLSRVASPQDLPIFAHAADNPSSSVAATAFSAALGIASRWAQTELSSEWFIEHHKRLCARLENTEQEVPPCSVFVCHHWATIIATLKNGETANPEGTE